MMKRTAEIAPPNSLLLLMDPASGEIPELIGERLVAATASCVAVGTLSAQDGTTRIILTDELAPQDNAAPVYDGVIATPNRTLAVCTVLLDVLVEIDVPSTRARLRVWANHPTEPDEILALVS
jgi:hypothetical protein